MDKNYDIITFISKYLILKKSREARFADIMKIATMFVKTTFQNSKKLNKLEIMH